MRLEQRVWEVKSDFYWTIYVTFSHERRNFEIHDRIRRVVGHVVLFHIIKLHSSCNSFLLCDWTRQAKKAAEFLYFPSSVLKKNPERSDIIIAPTKIS